MLFLVVEHFRDADAAPVYRRFRERGRMLPAEVRYVASWVESDHSRCWQIMECERREQLDPWLAAWGDLVDFEVTEVLDSASVAARFAAAEEGSGDSSTS